MVICPITSQYKPYPFIVVLADQVKSLDWKKRNVEFIQTAPAKVLTEVTMYTRGIIEGRTGVSI
jgi:mRNA interferase MazF